eukprot:9658537-Alexandrium_andersonii.AAC.1
MCIRDRRAGPCWSRLGDLKGLNCGVPAVTLEMGSRTRPPLRELVAVPVQTAPMAAGHPNGCRAV